jgi:hypothetical protein
MLAQGSWAGPMGCALAFTFCRQNKASGMFAVYSCSSFSRWTVAQREARTLAYGLNQEGSLI